MVRSHLLLAVVCVCLLLSFAGCMPSVVGTSHEYVLVRTEGEDLVAIPDDDPLYQRFDGEVLGDPYLARLLMVFEHTTESFLATNTFTSLDQTVANRLIIVVDSSEMGVLHNVTVHQGGREVPIELAMGLGQDGSVDLVLARERFARVMAPLLLELVGLKPDRMESQTHPWIYEITDSSQAFWVGFEAAREGIDGQQHGDLVDELRARESPSLEVIDRLYRYELIPLNGLRFRFEEGQPTSEIRSPEEALHTPGVVAGFIYRLLEHAGSFYPQRYMLWFTSFDPDEMPYAKLLLATSRMPRYGEVSIQGFIGSYAETFPAESASVKLLAEEIFGSHWR